MTDPRMILLSVPYEFQLDNASGTGYRECFSSSCAMVASFHKVLHGGDDAYNKLRAKYGDTTDVQAHIGALRSLGLNPKFVTNANAELLRSELRTGRPVPVGWLHKGPINKPTGGGHWTVVVGYKENSWLHNDPNGEADIICGGYVNHLNGKFVEYSYRWLRRWEVDGPSTGWALLVRP